MSEEKKFTAEEKRLIINAWNRKVHYQALDCAELSVFNYLPEELSGRRQDIIDFINGDF